MRKFLLLIVFLSLGCINYVCAQAKKPTLMVVPSDLYCNQRGYIIKLKNQGNEHIIPDYKTALLNDNQLLTAITIIGQMMSDRGFPLKLLEQEIKSIETDNAETAMFTSKSGEDIKETPVEILNKRAKSDIILQVFWSINSTGPKRSLTFNLQGIDAYTNKQIAACQGTGMPTFSAELSVLLEESIANYLDDFNIQLQAHFDDLFNNGREISLTCRKWADSVNDFETEINGKELGVIIEDWLYKNTINGAFNTTDASENVMRFEQVRIPMFNETGRAIDARQWARGLVNHLKQLGIESKLTIRGLGHASIIIGGK